MLFGTSFIPVTSRLVQIPSRPFSPSIGGIAADEPVEMTIFSASISSAPTLTRPPPLMRPRPRNSSMPRSSSQVTCPESSQLETTSSRHFRASATSISPVTALRAPHARFAAATVSAGRSSVFDGMQAQ